jgi:hypothetical protein
MTAQLKMPAAEPVQGPFVINLCASTTPMALAQPDAPELKRFNFFVSRRREEGRERFRLHMGYFVTLAEAEEWLGIVRDVYPGAWAGEAPGKRLAEKAAAAKAPALPVAVAAAVAVVPTLQAAPRAAAPKVAAPKPAPAKIASPKAATSLSNVKEVLKALDETDETRVMPAPTPVPAAQAASLSDSQVLKILENRRVDKQPQGKEDASHGIAMLRPDDTTTVRALKDAVRDNAPVLFAVQLQWSVQPIDINKMPPLAIFSAYTLYTVEGSRDGRKWYGLRLGFFSDAVSAKQVASYVRSEFTSVAVIPVSSLERGKATDGVAGGSKNNAARPRHASAQREEFKLIDDVTDDVGMPGLAAAQAQLKAPKPPAKPAKKSAGRVRATEKRSPKTLEETLEILGAGQLEIDNGRGEFLNDSGVRHLKVEVQKNSPFSKLLDRLAERVRKG